MQASGSTQNSNRLTSCIMLGLALGIAAGYVCNQLARTPAEAAVIAGYFSIGSDIFLRMIKMIIAPLVFATIVSGIASLGSSGGAVGRIAFKALAWFITACCWRTSSSRGMVWGLRCLLRRRPPTFRRGV